MSQYSNHFAQEQQETREIDEMEYQSDCNAPDWTFDEMEETSYMHDEEVRAIIAANAFGVVDGGGE